MIRRLQTGTIDIYYFHTAIFNADKFFYILDESEIQTFHSYQRVEKREEFLAGRYLLKSVLAAQWDVEQNRIVLKKAPYGKLTLDDNHINGENIRFNLSHSKGLIACSFVKDHEIGIDLEKIERDLTEISNRFFHPQEVEFLDQYEKNQRNKLAYKVWTLKEAYLKAKGIGMTCPMGSFNVLGCNEMFFHTFEPVPEYILSVAVQADKDQEFEIRLKEVSGF